MVGVLLLNLQRDRFEALSIGETADFKQGWLCIGSTDQDIVLATGEGPPTTAIPHGLRIFDVAKAGEHAKE
jgi:hypothetical protein